MRPGKAILGFLRWFTSQCSS